MKRPGQPFRRSSPARLSAATSAAVSASVIAIRALRATALLIAETSTAVRASGIRLVSDCERCCDCYFTTTSFTPANASALCRRNISNCALWVPTRFDVQANCAFLHPLQVCLRSRDRFALTSARAP
eukprot:scaffold79735_cov64-Phaeocystis_antarctica.AAC.3